MNVRTSWLSRSPLINDGPSGSDYSKRAATLSVGVFNCSHIKAEQFPSRTTLEYPKVPKIDLHSAVFMILHDLYLSYSFIYALKTSYGRLDPSSPYNANPRELCS